MTRQSLNVYHPPDVHQSLLSRPTGSILVSYKSKLSRLLLPRARCQPWLHCREISEIDLDMHPAKLDHNGSISTRLTKPDDSGLVMWLLIGSQQLWLVSETGATIYIVRGIISALIVTNNPSLMTSSSSVSIQEYTIIQSNYPSVQH